MRYPSRRAWVTSGILVGLFLFVTEFILVFGLTLGVFHEMGFEGWWALVATIVFAAATIWLLAWCIAFVSGSWH